MASPFQFDDELPRLWSMLRALVEMTAVWARRGEFDETVVDALRHQAILVNFERYVRLLDVYDSLGVRARLGGGVNFEEVIDEFMLPCDVFKSYDPDWLQDGDFAQMTHWLGRRFFRQPIISLEGVADVDTWRERLRSDRVYLSYSSGTSGSLSFVPRDAVAYHALRTNGAASFHRALPDGATGIADLACLVLAARGSGMGIQGAATGLARAARRSHFLFDEEITASDLHRSAADRPRASADDVARANKEAIAFLRAEASSGTPLLIFGTPFELERVCTWVIDNRLRLPLPAGSLIVTGGGWKGGPRIATTDLLDHVELAFAVPPHAVIDVYSTTECNAVLLTCIEGRYHVPPLVEPVLLDDLLTRVEGEEALGILGLLDPFAVSYPGFLITGDQVRLTHRRCPCGLAGWSIVGTIERAPSAEAKGCAGVLASMTG